MPPDRPNTMSSPHQRWSPLAAGLLGAGLVLGGCSASTQDAAHQSQIVTNSPGQGPKVESSELADAAGEPCPDQLPMGEDPDGYGHGVQSSATELPDLLEPEQAWVCQYTLVEHFATDPESGDLEVSGGVWVASGEPDELPGARLSDLQQALDGLTLVEPDMACTADLGPRWLVSYLHDGDLTGVVVDDFGCPTVLLTDQPHLTPPGEADHGGVVEGRLAGGHDVLVAVGLREPL